MALKFYNRKTKQFYIRKPKLVHVGPVNGSKGKTELTDDEKYKISELVDKVEYLGEEFGAETIVSTSQHDIFKIRDEVKNNKDLINKKSIEKIKEKQVTNSIDIIKEQLGISD